MSILWLRISVNVVTTDLQSDLIHVGVCAVWISLPKQINVKW